MKKIELITISKLANRGQRAEQNACAYYTGKMSAPDAVRFDIGDDIPAVNMSVKSAHFTLCAASLLDGATLSDKLGEFFARVHSSRFLYVCENERDAYEMDAEEFRAFCLAFCKLDADGLKNGRGQKVRAQHESAKMREWLEVRATY